MAETTKTKKTQKSDKSYYEGIGRRKTSVARVRVYHAKKTGATINDVSYKAGSYIINGLDIKKWTASPADQVMLRRPIQLLDDEGTYVIFSRVANGGSKGQRDALIHGLARALVNIPSEDLRSKLKANGLLTRDSRTRERRKVGTGGKSRRLKQSPKR